MGAVEAQGLLQAPPRPPGDRSPGQGGCGVPNWLSWLLSICSFILKVMTTVSSSRGWDIFPSKYERKQPVTTPTHS